MYNVTRLESDCSQNNKPKLANRSDDDLVQLHRRKDSCTLTRTP